MSAANGGPAFPVLELDRISGQVIDQHFGLSLRDYFAARAPVTVEDAMLSCGVTAASIGMLPQSERAVIFAVLAVMRGEYADAMLAERSK